MKDKTQNIIIDDLLLKRPKGPAGGSKLTYASQREYNYNRGRYVNVSVCSDQRYGYSDATLFSLGLRSSSDVKAYIRNRFFEGKSEWEIGRKKSTVTRRTNRLWERISGSISRVERTGGKGIYAVSRPYSSATLGYVYSSNTEEAITMADMFFPPLENDRYTVRFIEIGSVDRLYYYNTKIRKTYEDKLERHKLSIEQAKNNIEKITNHMTMLTVLEGHQVAIEMNT